MLPLYFVKLIQNVFRQGSNTEGEIFFRGDGYICAEMGIGSLQSLASYVLLFMRSAPSLFFVLVPS